MKTDIISVFYSASGATAAGRRLCSVKNRVLFERSEFTRFSVTTDWGANELRSRALLVTFLAEKSNVTSGCKPRRISITATRGNRQSFDTNARRDTISCISDKKRNLHVQIGHFIFKNIIFTCRLENLFLEMQSTYAD